MTEQPQTPEMFEQLLAGQHENFIVLGALRPARTHIRFTGRYAGQQVIWDATVLALLHERPADQSLAQYIEIPATSGPLAAITIGLAISRIDLPALRKTVIMIRNYRRLRPGRHEFAG